MRRLRVFGDAVRSIPGWLWWFLAVFVLKGVFLVFVGLPFYGEDEIAHFGYIEAMERTGAWYSFEDNYSSVGSRVVRQLFLERPELSERIIDTVQAGRYAYLQEYASGIHNATAYQPPLYYWSMARIVRLLPSLSVVSLLYVLRLMSVGFGLLVVVSSYWLARLVLTEEWSQALLVGVVTFTPLLGLMSSTVTVQIAVIGFFSLLVVTLTAVLKHGFQRKLVALAGVILGLGLLTQQAFFSAPVLMVVVGILVWNRERRLQRFMMWLGVVGVVVLLALPDYWQRMSDARILVNPTVIDQPFLEWWHYPLSQGGRLKTVVMDQFWDQHNSFLPFRASESLVRVMQGIVLVGVLGFLSRIWLGWQQVSRFHREVIVLGFLAVVGFLAAHLYYDWLQLSHGGQEYFKARYLYPLLPMLVGGLVVGWRSVLGRFVFARMIYLGILTIMIWLHGSGVIWLLFMV